jgi:hypothetical protein
MVVSFVCTKTVQVNCILIHGIGRWYEYIDVNPLNGKLLLLFDSRMVHSVEKVLNKIKTRRALTLWMVRPEESGATGEDYYLIGDDGGIVEN